MGNIRTKDIKNVSFELVETYPDRFSKDFDANKDSLRDMKFIKNKLMRNKIAGYITRIKSYRK